MTAQTALMQIAGLDLLELRVERCYKNCLSIGGYLHMHPEVIRVDYPGLAGTPGYEKALQYFGGIPGTILTFDLKSEAACFSFMNRLKVIRRATNLNDNKTLLIHPWSTIYAEFPEEARIEMGIRTTMMRLSAGIENVDDLIEDIEGALIDFVS